MKHLKVYEDFTEKEYIFTPDANLMKMMEDWKKLWDKGVHDNEVSVTSLTGDRFNVEYFPFLGNKETEAKQKEILDAAVKGGYKAVKPISNPPTKEDWMEFSKAIAPTLKK
jgi:hypothetical protein